MPREDDFSDPEDQQHIQPLITSKHELNTPKISSNYEIRFKNFDENEEATKMY